MFVIHANDPLNEIYAWYKEKLPANGYKIMHERDVGSKKVPIKSLAFKKGQTESQIRMSGPGNLDNSIVNITTTTLRIKK